MSGGGVACQILPCTLPNTANTHMLDRTEQKPLSCCLYCFVSGTAVHFLSYKGRLTKDFKPGVTESRKKCGGRRTRAFETEPLVYTLPLKAVNFAYFIPGGGKYPSNASTH